jgi:hypothetical protein
MPRADVQKRIQRYFHPLTSRARFSPERVLLNPALATRYITFGPETKDLNGRNPKGSKPASPTLPTDIFQDDAPALHRVTGDPLIPKPSGEVSRISRDGYNLRKELGWKPDFYTQVQVRSHSLLRRPSEV